MSFWNGSIYKHRDYCGDITNHVGIVDMEPEVDPETKKGTLEVYFVDGDSEIYEFEITKDVVDRAKQVRDRYGDHAAQTYLAYWVEEEMNRLRELAEEDADPYFRV